MRLILCLVLALSGSMMGRAWAHPPLPRPAQPFASGLIGPEGLAFTRAGTLVVGSTTGEIRQFAPNGSSAVLANVGERLAGISVLHDGRVVAAAFNTGRIWSVTPDGTASVLANGVNGANFIVQTARGQILVSASLLGTIVDVASGTPVVLATGLAFPNGLAIGRDGLLYVAETLGNRVSRLPIAPDGSLGAATVYATGLPLADGLAFDRRRNLLVAGGGTLKLVTADTGNVLDLLVGDPQLNGAANLAFGRGRGFSRREIYVANFGPAFGDGTTVSRFRYNHAGDRLIR